MSQTTSNLSSVSQKPKTKPTKLYKLCPACKDNPGQYPSDKAKALGFKSLPCPYCTQRWVVPADFEIVPVEPDPLLGGEP